VSATPSKPAAGKASLSKPASPAQQASAGISAPTSAAQTNVSAPTSAKSTKPAAAAAAPAAEALAKPQASIAADAAASKAKGLEPALAYAKGPKAPSGADLAFEQVPQNICWVASLPSGDEITTIQRLLLLSGFDAGPVDGRKGLRTRNALYSVFGPNGRTLPPEDIIAELTHKLCTKNH
jgi:hypothetical protein